MSGPPPQTTHDRTQRTYTNLLLLLGLFTLPNQGFSPPGTYKPNSRESDACRGATGSGPEH